MNSPRSGDWGLTMRETCKTTPREYWAKNSREGIPPTDRQSTGDRLDLAQRVQVHDKGGAHVQGAGYDDDQVNDDVRN
jgi:hypothetical protein